VIRRIPTRILAAHLPLLAVTFLLLPYIIRAVKSRRIRWAGHVARMGRKEIRTVFWWRNVEEKDHLEDFGVDGGYLEWAGLYSCAWGQGRVAKSFKRSDELQCLKFP